MKIYKIIHVIPSLYTDVVKAPLCMPTHYNCLYMEESCTMLIMFWPETN